jgi:UDP-2-acetamido-2-deoxy-ribo-hexuluronate aminotransferase
MSNIPFIDLKTQYKALKESIDARIQTVLNHGAFVNGPEVQEAETKLAQFVGSKYALTCASGTDALLIPLMAKGIGPGDEVITTAFSFIATAEIIILSGAQPVYVDIDPVTYNLDLHKVEAAITKKTKAIVPVSLYGQTPDMDSLNTLAKKHNLLVLEDAAQSFGATFKNRRSCNLSEIAGTSFFPAKPLGCYGDGGAIFTNDDKLLTIMKEIREHGSERRYYHTRIGINGRLDTLQCAILLAKLERYEWELGQRQKIAQRFNSAFGEIRHPAFQIPEVMKDLQSAWAQYTLGVPNRDRFQQALTQAGVPTSIHYPMIMPDQPAYKQPDTEKKFPVARAAAQRVISLPMYPDMPGEIQDRIIEETLKALKQVL